MLTESPYQLSGARNTAASVLGQEPVIVMAASDAVRNIPAYRARLRQQGVSGVALLSSDAARRHYATPYELMVALAPARRRTLIDTSGAGSQERVGGLASLTFRCAVDAVTAGGYVLRELMASRNYQRTVPLPRPASGSRCLLALWRDAGASGVGGAVSHVSGILSGFRRLGWQVVLVTSSEPPQQLRSAVNVVEVAVPLPRGARFTRESARIAANESMRRAALSAARRMPPAFVYERNAFLSRAGADVSRELGVPMVLEWNASDVWVNRNWYRHAPLSGLFQTIGARVERYSVRSATVVAAVSQGAAQIATDMGADSATVAVMPNAVDPDSVPAPSPMPPRERAVVGWIGSFGPWHGVEVAVESLQHLPANVEFVLIGDGEQRAECERLARRLGVHDRITWSGTLPRPEALRMLSDCDVLLSPHHWTGSGPFFGSPTKLFEYMALGRPIVASRLDQIGEILQDGVTAVLTEPGDPADLARGVTQVLAMPDRGAELGVRARRDALENHTWDRRAEQILARLPLSAACTAAEGN
ncbi:glycosyltransferase family 4 protein [Streptomyces sp. NBC_00390]|uniref:glycosyltransferase family 4 protein n=1 Tax=Streptomyces sp. NBC_00390 TaxID=2975736 RepID=UPI002E23144E